MSEIDALLAGIRVDEILLRWHPRLASEIEQLRNSARSAIERGEFGAVPALRLRAQERVAASSTLAADSQLKVDRRDYIAAALVDCLSEMGFVVSEPTPEETGRYDTALVFDARASSGRGLAVSVPAEGDVWYEADGYPIVTSPLPDGTDVVTRDEVEGLLDDLGEILNERFGAQMEKAMWEGKADPDRLLRRADDLPEPALREAALR